MKDQTKIRISVDFNSRDENSNIVINTDIPDQEYLKDKLIDGLLVILYDETLEVSACVKWNEDIGMWVGIPDWKSIHHII
jgi:hypothetical protein